MRSRFDFIALFLVFLSVWLLLTGLTLEEIIVGSLASIIITILSYRLFSFGEKQYTKRFFLLLAYIPWFVYQEILSHLDVIYRIITGRIKPAIIEVKHNMKSDLGIMTLANSITLTPGTLTLDVDEGKFFVHWINIKPDRKNIAQRFERFLKRIWD
ncbi:MAG: Na+/H+ antiporter subunit E [Candidatus Aenigmatarchaeota archaeon]|nr:MAG: Na+/H+ antiporter subunit E [Candidatus Aenigmarchaeota archaeon]